MDGEGYEAGLHSEAIARLHGHPGKHNIKNKYNDICTIETWLSCSSQLLWADDGRLSIQRSADYLNSVVNEVRIIHNVHRLNINR